MESIAVPILLGLSKQLGGRVLEALRDDQAAVHTTLNDELWSGADGSMGQRINNLRASRRMRNRLLKSGTLFDLAAIAWAELLGEMERTVVEGLGKDREFILRTLGAEWFLETTLGPNAIACVPTVPLDLEQGTDVTSLDALRDDLMLRAAEELDENVTDHLRGIVNDVIDALPGRIEALYLELPGTVEKRTLRLAERLLKRADGLLKRADENVEVLHRIESRLDGSFIAKRVTELMDAEAKRLMAGVEADVFSRERSEIEPNDLPYLPLAMAYIEPAVTISRGPPALKTEAKSKSMSVLQAIRTAWKLGSPVVLVAPFGFGKSLTSRKLAADLAGDWLQKTPGSPFPIFVTAEGLLRGRTVDLEAAVLRALQQRDFPKDVAQVMWNEFPLAILVDAFDEVELPEAEARAWISDLEQASTARVQILVTSRPHAVSARRVSAKTALLELRSFDSERIRRWLEVTPPLLGARSMRHEDVVAVLGDGEDSGTPILLLMAAWIGFGSAQTEKLTRTDLYAKFVDKIATGKWSDVQRAHPVIERGREAIYRAGGSASFLHALGLLAWMHRSAEARSKAQRIPFSGLSARTIESRLTSEFKRSSAGGELSNEDVQEVLRSMLLSLFLRKSVNDHAVHFTHRSFREFLCARYFLDAVEGQWLADRWTLRALIGEAPFSDSEIAFLVDLATSRGEQSRKALLGLADEAYLDPRDMFVRSHDSLSRHSIASDDEILFVDSEGNRRPAAKKNGEAIAAKIRGVEIARDRRFRVPDAPRRATAFLDGEYRRLAASPIWSDRVLTYHRDTGELALVFERGRPRTELFLNLNSKWGPTRWFDRDGWVVIPIPECSSVWWDAELIWSDANPRVDGSDRFLNCIGAMRESAMAGWCTNSKWACELSGGRWLVPSASHSASGDPLAPTSQEFRPLFAGAAAGLLDSFLKSRERLPVRQKGHAVFEVISVGRQLWVELVRSSSTDLRADLQKQDGRLGTLIERFRVARSGRAADGSG